MLAEVGYYLRTYLEPLTPFLDKPDVTDIYLNRPGELWTESIAGKIKRHQVDNLTHEVLTRLSRQVASYAAQGISREQPLLAANLPDGARVQIVIPPATRGDIAIAIRKHVAKGLPLDAYVSEDANSIRTLAHGDLGAEYIYVEPNPPSMAKLRAAVRDKRTILVSGGTSTGKTTFLSGLLQEVPTDERLILIEDTAELALTHPNSVGLIAARGSMGEARIEMEDLLVAALRMRPDRIILGEIRGSEALTFLRAANTGHPGSMSSVHADSPSRAIDQLALLALQGGSRLAWDNVVRNIRRSVDVIVQLERVGGRRRISEIAIRGDMVDVPLSSHLAQDT